MIPIMLDRVRERVEGRTVVGFVILESGKWAFMATRLVENVGEKRPAYYACNDKSHSLFDSNSNGRRTSKVDRERGRAGPQQPWPII